MTYIWQVSVIGSLAGVLGTGLGGLLIALFGKPHRTVLGFLLAFSGGIMLTVVCRDLLPEALALGNPFSTLAGLCGGIAAMFALNHVVPHIHPNSQESRAFLRIGLLIGVGIAMHNFPEGLAIGAGYAASDSLGLGLAIALALHNIPEGMAMAGPLIAGKVAPFGLLYGPQLQAFPWAWAPSLGRCLAKYPLLGCRRRWALPEEPCCTSFSMNCSHNPTP